MRTSSQGKRNLPLLGRATNTCNETVKSDVFKNPDPLCRSDFLNREKKRHRLQSICGVSNCLKLFARGHTLKSWCHSTIQLKIICTVSTCLSSIPTLRDGPDLQNPQKSIQFSVFAFLQFRALFNEQHFGEIGKNSADCKKKIFSSVQPQPKEEEEARETTRDHIASNAFFWRTKNLRYPIPREIHPHGRRQQQTNNHQQKTQTQKPWVLFLLLSHCYPPAITPNLSDIKTPRQELCFDLTQQQQPTANDKQREGERHFTQEQKQTVFEKHQIVTGHSFEEKKFIGSTNIITKKKKSKREYANINQRRSQFPSLQILIGVRYVWHNTILFLVGFYPSNLCFKAFFVYRVICRFVFVRCLGHPSPSSFSLSVVGAHQRSIDKVIRWAPFFLCHQKIFLPVFTRKNFSD